MNEPVVNTLEPLARVTRREGLQPLAQHFDAIRDWLAVDLGDLERELDLVGGGQDGLAMRSAAWLLNRPGKRIRPLCVLLAARLGPRPAPGMRDLAVACELAHAATLLHDDVIDLGEERRGAPTARMVYGNSASVLGGDHLLVEALQRVDRAGHPHLLTALLGVIGDMVAGEALQLELRGRFNPDPALYDRIVAAKTSSLFAWAMQAGTTAAGCSTAEVTAAARFGSALGQAFQLTDDALDLAGDPARTGKDALLDLREGKLTWPLLIAVQREPDLLVDLQAVAADPAALADAGRRADLCARLVSTGCIAATRLRARECAAVADSALTVFAPGPARTALAAVVAAVLDREN